MKLGKCVLPEPQRNKSNKFVNSGKKNVSKDFDLLFVLTADDKVWIIPEEEIVGSFTISLRDGGKYDQYRISSA